jgi:hypothetical protein
MLRRWVDADREGERIKQRLDEAAAEWAKHGRDPGYLDHGPRLALARKWSDDHPGALGALAVDFLAASLARERSEEAARLEEARKREAEKSKFIRRWTYALLTATCVAVVLATYAFVQWNNAQKATDRAEAQTRIATSRQLAALSASERNKRLDRSLLLAVEALRAENTFEARDSLYKALQDRPGLRSFLHTREGDVRSVAFSPDGKTLAAGYGVGGVGGGGAVLWDVSARKRLAEDPLPVREGDVWSVAFSPDGKTLAAGYGGVVGGGGAVLWDVDLNSWQRLAGRIANRNFTRDEWRQYFPEEPYRPTFPDLPVSPEVASQEREGRR